MGWREGLFKGESCSWGGACTVGEADMREEDCGQEQGSGAQAERGRLLCQSSAEHGRRVKLGAEARPRLPGDTSPFPFGCGLLLTRPGFQAPWLNLSGHRRGARQSPDLAHPLADHVAFSESSSPHPWASASPHSLVQLRILGFHVSMSLPGPASVTSAPDVCSQKNS